MNRFLFLAGILLQSFCYFLSTSGQRAVTNDYPLGARIYTFILPFETSYYSGIELVAGNRSTLTLNVKYFVGDPGPVCFLQVVPNDTMANISSWTKPCPRTPQQVPPLDFWCLFGFSSDGNLLLKSGANVSNGVENGTVLWSSNTTGMGVQSLGLLDSDPEGLGNLVLYNANKEIVWRNIANNAGSEDYSCSYLDQAPVGAPLSTPDGAPAASPVFSDGPAAASPEFGTAPTPSAGRKLLQH